MAWATWGSSSRGVHNALRALSYPPVIPIGGHANIMMSNSMTCVTAHVASYVTVSAYNCKGRHIPLYTPTCHTDRKAEISGHEHPRLPASYAKPCKFATSQLYIGLWYRRKPQAYSSTSLCSPSVPQFFAILCNSGPVQACICMKPCGFGIT